MRGSHTWSWISSRIVAPPVERPVELHFFGDRDRPVERDPAHHFRVCESVAAGPAPPRSLRRVHASGLRAIRATNPNSAQLLRAQHHVGAQLLAQSNVGQLAVHVELELFVGGVAGTDRLRAARNRGSQSSSSSVRRRSPATPVHRLQLFGATGRRPQQPLAASVAASSLYPPAMRASNVRCRLGGPSSTDSPSCANLQRLGQRRGGSRDDAARRLVGQRLECEQRSQDRIAPLTGVVAAGRPVFPVFRRA